MGVAGPGAHCALLPFDWLPRRKLRGMLPGRAMRAPRSAVRRDVHLSPLLSSQLMKAFRARTVIDHRTTVRDLAVWRVPVLLLALLGLVACGGDDPFRGSATVPNEVSEISMAAFSTGTVAPSALDLVSLRVVRPELQSTGTVNFQLALDVNASGTVSLLPVLALLSPPNGGTSVGLQRTAVAFDDITRAPVDGFTADSVLTTQRGEAVFFLVQAGVCTFGEPFYGKLVVEGVNTETRRLIVRILINRNCGFRDLTIGLPRN